MTEIRVDTHFVASVFNMTSSLLERFNYRITGTAPCREAARAIEETMASCCGQTRRETFDVHPGSLYRLGMVFACAYIIAFLLLILGGALIYAAFFICLIGLVYAFIHYILYGKTFDVFFKKQTGCNVVGVLEPAQEAKRQVIVMGHHDSAYIFGYLTRFPALAGIRMALGALFYVLLFVLAAIAMMGSIMGETSGLNGVSLYLAAAGLLFTVPMFFFFSHKPSPGAGDNLNGSSMAVHIAKYFSEQSGGDRLQNTRLIVLSTDGEEAGQRGAIAFVRKHKQELLELPARVLNMDSIYQLKELAVILRDRHGTMPLSAGMAQDICSLAETLGYKVKKIPASVGSGTDAAAFAKEGIEAASIIAMNTSMFYKGHIYHTAKDTLEAVEPEAVKATMEIALNYIRLLDHPDPSQ